MDRYLICAVSISLSMLATTVFSATQPDPGPGVIDLRNGSKVLVFPHRNHQSLYRGKCHVCHTPDGFKMQNWGKEIAHDLCITCHAQKSHGPSQCVECHEY